MTLSTPSYNRLLLFVAGLGGLLYGIDVGIIAGALPYLEATSGLTAGQLSFIVAAVLLGSVISTFFAGALADRFGRRPLMTWSGVLFVLSIPVIALSESYYALVLGRLLQGISAGLIGVVIPLYLAECLLADQRGRGTAVFQWMLTLGIVLAALIGMYFSYRVESVTAAGNAADVLALKEWAWRSIFWASLPPGLIFVAGTFLVAESPRWLVKRNQADAALAALRRSRAEEAALLEWNEMKRTQGEEQTESSGGGGSLFQRRYVVPFVLACVILACNQATGVNSIIGYSTSILIQSGLSDVEAHWGYVVLTVVNFTLTMVGVALVDRRGRKFLLSLGTAGIIVALVATGWLFRQNESRTIDCRETLQALVTSEQGLQISFDQSLAQSLWSKQAANTTGTEQAFSLVVIYRYGDFRTASPALRSDFPAAQLSIRRETSLPANPVIGFFSQPFGDLDDALQAPLQIENARLTPLPAHGHGWWTAGALFLFMGFFAIGPGVCVWLALSELMPSRIRSNGMSIALLINQAVSTSIAGFFLPTVGQFGYGTVFFAFAGCTVIYWVAATFFLPETKGKTLEEIESFFTRR